MMKISTAAAIVIASSAAHAGEIVQSGSLPHSPTDWASTVMIDRFDTMGGARTLLEVNWWISGSITGMAEIESLDASPASISVMMRADLSAQLAGVSLTTVSPELIASFDASPFDGVIDFGGASGATFGPMDGSVSAQGDLFDVAIFEGVGQIPLSFQALGASWTTGSGNLLTSFTTTSDAEFEIVYRYAIVPAPGSAGMVVLTGIALARRRRR